MLKHSHVISRKKLFQFVQNLNQCPKFFSDRTVFENEYQKSHPKLCNIELNTSQNFWHQVNVFDSFYTNRYIKFTPVISVVEHPSPTTHPRPHKLRTSPTRMFLVINRPEGKDGFWYLCLYCNSDRKDSCENYRILIIIAARPLWPRGLLPRGPSGREACFRHTI